MTPSHLKALVETGHYKPAPGLIAEAMLDRRGFRTFLGSPLSSGRGPAGHSRRAAAGGHRSS
jgi:hypothetical protein